MICVPISAKSNKEALEQIKKAEEFADIIELRLDIILEPDLASLIAACNKKVIVTVRKKSEGGQSDISDAERIKLLQKAIELKVDYIDVELDNSSEFDDLCINAKEKGIKVIRSFHNFEKTDEKEVMEKCKLMIEKDADVVKIATKANSINDNLIIFDMIKKVKDQGKEVIGICMGEYGEISRIIGKKFGNLLTFAKLEEGTADGQINVEVMRNIFHYDKISVKTKIYGLVGKPVSKSKGYIIHNTSFVKLGIDAVYVNFLVDDMPEFISGFNQIFDGLSVTMPFKEEVIPCLDEIDEITENIGAVNTVVKLDGKLKGYNTDYLGALKAIEERISIDGKNVLMIGAGGVSKAISFGLKGKGAKVTITDIDVVKAKELAENAGLKQIDVNDVEGIDADILVNATPVGMHPNVDRLPVKKIY